MAGLDLAPVFFVLSVLILLGRVETTLRTRRLLRGVLSIKILIHTHVFIDHLILHRAVGALVDLSITSLADLQVVEFVDELLVAVIQEALHLISWHGRDLRSLRDVTGSVLRVTSERLASLMVSHLRRHAS